MLSYSTWRAAARIPWVRDNLDGLRFLRTTLYLLLALHRLGRRQDFQWTLRVFFEMAHTFAQYGRTGARETIDALFAIPWFFDKRRTLLTVIASFNRIRHQAIAPGYFKPTESTDWQDVEVFVVSLKEIMRFDAGDERRVRAIMEEPGALEEIMAELQVVTHC